MNNVTQMQACMIITYIHTLFLILTILEIFSYVYLNYTYFVRVFVSLTVKQ